MSLKHPVSPEHRIRHLKNGILENGFVRLIEAHNGLSALLNRPRSKDRAKWQNRRVQRLLGKQPYRFRIQGHTRCRNSWLRFASAHHRWNLKRHLNTSSSWRRHRRIACPIRVFCQEFRTLRRFRSHNRRQSIPKTKQFRCRIKANTWKSGAIRTEDMDDGFILVFSDILFNESILKSVLESKGDIVLVVDDSYRYHKHELNKKLDLINS